MKYLRSPAVVFLRGLSVLAVMVAGREAGAQHSHINAGARSATVGAPLFFANGAGFEADSGYLVHLEPTDSARYGPIYFGGAAVTFTSLPATADNGGPSSFAALPGTHVEMVVESVDGPAGGALSFWDSFDGFFDATEITFTVPVGTTGGTNRFVLSENDGSAGADPYGHIHGRKFSANLPGLYRAGVRLFDTGGNGPGGGPLHAPSAPAYFLFQAGISIASITVSSDGVRVRFGSLPDTEYRLESSAAVGPGADWKVVSGPITGTGRMIETEAIPVSGAPVFFRLRVGS